MGLWHILWFLQCLGWFKISFCLFFIAHFFGKALASLSFYLYIRLKKNLYDNKLYALLAKKEF